MASETHDDLSERLDEWRPGDTLALSDPRWRKPLQGMLWGPGDGRLFFHGRDARSLVNAADRAGVPYRVTRPVIRPTAPALSKAVAR